MFLKRYAYSEVQWLGCKPAGIMNRPLCSSFKNKMNLGKSLVNPQDNYLPDLL